MYDDDRAFSENLVPRKFTLSEYEELIVGDLDPELAQKIDTTNIVNVSRKMGGEFVLTADCKVGFVNAGGVQINVKPRFPIYNLFYFLGLTKAVKLQDDKVNIDLSEDFLTLLFQIFLESVEKSTLRGLLSGYQRREESSPVLRGRMEIGRQIRHGAGLQFPLEIAFDEFTEGVSENRILKKALQVALKYGNLHDHLRKRAQGLWSIFKEIEVGSELDSWSPSRLNSHYEDSLRLAELILSGNGFSDTYGNILVNGFSIDMHRVFENFVARELLRRIESLGDGISINEGLELDLGGNHFVRPDIVWHRGASPYQVMDTKYKKTGGLDAIEDINQIIIYASLLGLKRGHLIYGVAGEDRNLVINSMGIAVVTHGLDLSQSPDSIQTQLDELISNMDS